MNRQSAPNATDTKASERNPLVEENILKFVPVMTAGGTLRLTDIRDSVD